MKFSIQLVSFFLLFVVSLSAQIPTNYYSGAEGKTEAALKSELASIVSNGAVDKGYSFLYTIYETSDNLPNGKVWDMYSLKSDGTAQYYFSHGSETCGSYSGEGSCYNREHTFCDSWLGNSSPQRSDAHHLIPTDGYVNNRRGSFPHGKVKSATWTSTNGSKLGSSDASTGYSGTVFEPIDEYKGDFARMYFYVATRYESKIGGWQNNGTAGAILSGNAYPAYKSWFYNLMLEWSRMDPVSPKEINRNNVIYTYQKNRNPYIDYPELSEYVWGNKKGLSWSASSSSIGLLSPSNASNLNFGTVAYQHTDTASVFVKGVGLTGDINLSITGTNASYFSLPYATISSADAIVGKKLIINYNANAVGSHTATLIVSGADFANVSVTLTAITTDDFMALPATEISSTSFTANWTASATANAYRLDVFTLSGSGESQSQVILSEDFTGGVPGTWAKDGYSDNTTIAGTIRMASGSQSCTLTTPTLDLAGTNNVLYARAKQYASDKNADLTVTIDGQSLAVWTTTSDFQTFSIALPSATKTSKIAFSAASGKRVHLDSVNVSSQAPAQIPESVNGYPVTLGNVLTYQVNGLSAQGNYYYTVTPIGGSTGISESINVRTFTTGARNIDEDKVTFGSSSTGIVVRNLSTNSRIVVYNMIGRKMADMRPESSEFSIDIQNRGVYLFVVESNNIVKSYKVIY